MRNFPPSHVFYSCSHGPPWKFLEFKKTFLTLLVWAPGLHSEISDPGFLVQTKPKSVLKKSTVILHRANSSYSWATSTILLASVIALFYVANCSPRFHLSLVYLAFVNNKCFKAADFHTLVVKLACFFTKKYVCRKNGPNTKKMPILKIAIATHRKQ